MSKTNLVKQPWQLRTRCSRHRGRSATSEYLQHVRAVKSTNASLNVCMIERKLQKQHLAFYIVCSKES